MTPGEEFAGMTVNERLYAAGLLEEFASAIHAADIRSAVDLLTKVGLAPAQARKTVDAVLQDPATYGYPREP